MKFLSTKSLLIIISLLLLISLTLVAAKRQYFQTEQKPDIAALVKLVGATRITEARLSGGFAYAPFTPLPKLEKKKRPEFSNDPSFNLLSNNSDIFNNSTILSSEDASTSNNNSEIVQTVDKKPLSTTIGRGVSDKTYLNNLLLSSELFTSSYFSSFTEEVSTRGAIERAGKKLSSTSRSKIAETTEFKALAAKIMFANIKQPTAETAYALGIVYIFRGNFNEAITSLETALAKSPNNAEILNDLAVAYLTRAEDEDDPQDLVYALAKAYDAVTINNSLPELKFNYSLLLEKLFLKNTAKKNWQEYLQIETNPEWRNLATEHLRRLEAPTLAIIWQQEKSNLAKAIEIEGENSPTAYKIIERYPNPARLYVIEELLAEWGENYLKNNPIATEKLRIVRVVGDALVKFQNDNMIRDMVAVINKLLQDGQSIKQLEQLAFAHQACKEGITLADQSLPVKAYEKLKEALTIFSKLNDKASETLVMLHLARCERALLKYEVSLKTISLVVKEGEKYKYPYLLGRAWSVDANTYLYKFDIAKSLSACHKAEFYLKIIKDWDDLTIVYLIFQSNALRLRNTKEGVKYSYLALMSFDLAIKKQAIPYLLSFFGENVLQIKQSKIAILFYDELVKILFEQGISTELAAVFQWRSLANYQVGNQKAAIEDLDQAKKYTQFIEDNGFRSLMEQEVNLELAEINLSTDPLKTIELLDKVALFFDKTTDRFHKTRTYLTQAQAYLRLNDFINTEKALQEAINEYEKQRGNIMEETNRISFFENMLTTYNEMIKLQISVNKDDEKAFNYTERSSARALLDILENTKQDNTLQNITYPLTIKNIQKNLPTGITILRYKVVSEKALIWVVQKNQINFVEVSIKEQNFADLVKGFLNNIQQGYSKERLQETSQSLYNLLINPIEEFLVDTKKIIIVPDSFLCSLPFSVLINPISKKYLIEDFAIGYSPSATIFIRCLEKELQINGKEKTLLAIGNPKFTYKNFPRLSYLSGAEREAQKIARLYPNSQLLLKEQATKLAFKENLAKYSIVHFAGHGLLDTESSLSSLLVLASGSETKSFDEEALYAYELYNYRFSKTQLVVLSACQTANGQNIKGEGVISIARPFLAGGVPCVIANLWNADDEASKELLISFHQNFLDGKNSLEALQQAQIALINSPNLQYRSPKIWATLVLLGSGIKH